MDERDFQHREGAAAGEGTGSSPRISIETNQTPSEGEGQGGATWQSQPTVEQPSATAY